MNYIWPRPLSQKAHTRIDNLRIHWPCGTGNCPKFTSGEGSETFSRGAFPHKIPLQVPPWRCQLGISIMKFLSVIRGNKRRVGTQSYFRSFIQEDVTNDEPVLMGGSNGMSYLTQLRSLAGLAHLVNDIFGTETSLYYSNYAKSLMNKLVVGNK